MTNKIRSKNVIFGLLLLSFFSLISCAQDKKDSENKNHLSEADSLGAVLEIERKVSDSLTTALDSNIQEVEGFPVFFGSKYEKFEHPKMAISEALKQHADLIPMQPVLGGKMEFRKIEVISEKWLLAIYDDGHVQGKAIYEYDLQPDGTFAFKLIATQE